jgi:hypothetical protein
MTNTLDNSRKNVTRRPLSQVLYLFVMLVYGEVVNEWAKHRGVKRAILHPLSFRAYKGVRGHSRTSKD